MLDNKKVTPTQSGKAVKQPQHESGAQFFTRVVKRTDIRNILSRLAK